MQPKPVLCPAICAGLALRWPNTAGDPIRLGFFRRLDDRLETTGSGQTTDYVSSIGKRNEGNSEKRNGQAEIAVVPPLRVAKCLINELTAELVLAGATYRFRD